MVDLSERFFALEPASASHRLWLPDPSRDVDKIWFFFRLHIGLVDLAHNGRPIYKEPTEFDPISFGSPHSRVLSLGVTHVSTRQKLAVNSQSGAGCSTELRIGPDAAMLIH